MDKVSRSAGMGLNPEALVRGKSMHQTLSNANDR